VDSRSTVDNCLDIAQAWVEGRTDFENMVVRDCVDSAVRLLLARGWLRNYRLQELWMDKMLDMMSYLGAAEQILEWFASSAGGEYLEKPIRLNVAWAEVA
jgi:hypothetical protein